jgi:predicted nuclease of restriction endonuclease-like (RecB) superfamily
MARKKATKKSSRSPAPREKAAKKGEPDELRATKSGLPAGYDELLDDLKSRVRSAQLKAAVAANRELIQLYWDIGRLIVERQEREGWGKSVVERLADDIQREFPGIKGFSPLNVWRMRAFYSAYAGIPPNLSQAVTELRGKKELSQAVTDSSGTPPSPVAELAWGHNLVLLFKLKEPSERLWYAAKAVEHGWSRAVLTVQIETDLYGRQGKPITNFAVTLPAPQSDLAQQTLKDPYIFDFLTLSEDAHERELEMGLVDHVQKFLIELGAGFAFVGRQVSLSVGDDEDYLDLLFYHLKLRCFVVIDLKMKKFTPADAGQMNYYLSAVDSLMKHPSDAPSIGLILCKSHDRVKAEYALRDISKPIGVAEWQTQLVQSLPEPLRSNLPTIEQIEEELGGAP